MRKEPVLALHRSGRASVPGNKAPGGRLVVQSNSARAGATPKRYLYSTSGNHKPMAGNMYSKKIAST
jgi:hypothetical protein